MMQEQNQTLHEFWPSLWPIDNITNDTSLDFLSNTSVSGHVTYTYRQRLCLAITWAFIGACGVTGNSMVVIAVLLSRKLRTATNVFVVNLAVADFLTSLSLIWSVVALLGKHGWPIPEAEWLCSAGGFIVFLCTGVSLYNLAAIALNRFVLITQSFDTYKKMYTPLNITIACALIWMISISLFLALPLAGIGGFGYDEENFTCTDLNHHPKNEIFQLIQSVVYYPIPLCTIIVSYASILHHVRSHFRQQKDQNLQNRPETPAISSSNKTGGSAVEKSSVSIDLACQPPSPKRKTQIVPINRSKRIDAMEVQITKNLFLVVCAFFVLFSPYCIVLFISDAEYLQLYLGTSVLINSMINPVIYSVRHPYFKVVFRCMIRCRYAEIPEPSSLLKRFLSKSTKC